MKERKSNKKFSINQGTTNTTELAKDCKRVFFSAQALGGGTIT